MKNPEYYTKHRVDYRPLVSPIFTKRYLWLTVLITLAVVLIEPFILYSRQRVTSISFDHYVQLLEYCVLIAVPLVSFVFWLNWREVIKRKRGYNWVGKFTVTKKTGFWMFCYLQVMPGEIRLKVERGIFDKIRVGDSLVVERDALGVIEKIRKASYISSRLARKNIRVSGKQQIRTTS